jgi:hypothetical protein
MRAGLHLKVGRITLARRTQHGAAQNTVQSAWVAAALAFEPFQHVGITPHGELLLDEPVKLDTLHTSAIVLVDAANANGYTTYIH